MLGLAMLAIELAPELNLHKLAQLKTIQMEVKKKKMKFCQNLFNFCISLHRVMPDRIKLSKQMSK